MRNLCIALTLITTAAAATIVQAQTISVTPARIDFGVMKPHEAKKKDVVIKNIGSGELIIHEVEVTCGCTVAELAKKKLGPGESTTLVINFDSKEFRGPQTKHVNIFSNDPVNGAFDLMILANVKVPLYWDSEWRTVGFETTRAGKTCTKVWNFWTEDVPALQMKVESKPAWVDIAIVNGVGGNKQKSQVTFTLRADTKPGRQRGTITLGTNIPAEPTFIAETATIVTQDLVLGTDRVAFNYVQPGQPLVTRVRVSVAEQGHPLQVDQGRDRHPRPQGQGGEHHRRRRRLCGHRGHGPRQGQPAPGRRAMGASRAP